MRFDQNLLDRCNLLGCDMINAFSLDQIMCIDKIGTELKQIAFSYSKDCKYINLLKLKMHTSGKFC